MRRADPSKKEVSPSACASITPLESPNRATCSQYTRSRPASVYRRETLHESAVRCSGCVGQLQFLCGRCRCLLIATLLAMNGGRAPPLRRSFTLPAGSSLPAGAFFRLANALATVRRRHLLRGKTGFLLCNGAYTARGLFAIHGPRSLLPMKAHQHSFSAFCLSDSRDYGAHRLFHAGEACHAHPTSRRGCFAVRDSRLFRPCDRLRARSGTPCCSSRTM